MITLADANMCTGCGACSFKCPKQCISMQPNQRGIVIPKIDEQVCVECHSCEKVCPILNPVSPNKPFEAYASWSNDAEERRTSASGGVAAELYKYALQNDYAIIGAVQNEDFSVSHILSMSKEDLCGIKNSKYVESSLLPVFPQISERLKRNEKLLFIGLPCQVAALRKLFRDIDKLLLVEVVCHGTTPQGYLNEHIQKIEKKTGMKMSRMSFRDPASNTETFHFSFYDNIGNCFYSKTPQERDAYQFGYHRGISYRENCYHCMFANRDRIADITLSDYKGLGAIVPCSYSSKKVSSVILNTEKGKNFFMRVYETGALHADLRPVDEPINGDRQLREPTRKIPERYLFERLKYHRNLGFSKTMQLVYLSYQLRMFRGYVLKYPKLLIKTILKKE